MIRSFTYSSVIFFFLIGYATVWILFLDIILVSTVSGADELFLHLSVLVLIHLWVYCPCSINVNAFSSECPTDQTWPWPNAMFDDMWLKEWKEPPYLRWPEQNPRIHIGGVGRYSVGAMIWKETGVLGPLPSSLPSFQGTPKILIHSIKLPVTYNALFYL